MEFADIIVEEESKEEQVKLLCNVIRRIPYKDRLLIYQNLEKKEWKPVRVISLDGYRDGLTTTTDREVYEALLAQISGTALAVVETGGRDGKDHYGFWLAGEIWQIYPNQELNFFKKIPKV